MTISALTENVKKIDEFMESMPECHMETFDWETASKLGVDTFHSLSEAFTKGGSQVASSYKSVISTAKKSLSDFVTAVSKAFILGQGLPWFQPAATKFLDTKTISSLPTMQFSNWKPISGSKCVSSDATSIMKIAFDTESLIHQIEDTFKSVIKDNCETSAPVIMRLVDSINRYQTGSLKSITSIGLASESSLASFENMREIVCKMTHQQVQDTLHIAIKQIGIIMAKVEKPPLSAEDVHAVSALSEKMCLLSTRLPDADNQEDVKLLGLCKVFVTCSNAKDLAVKEPDSREGLEQFIRPLMELHRVFRTPGSGKAKVTTQPEHQKACLTSIHDSLSRNSTDFKDAFPDFGTFETCFLDLENSATSLMTKRCEYYEKDTTQSVKNLEAMLKVIPEINPDEPDQFLKAIESVQQKLLDTCDSSAEIIISVEKDLSAFNCQPSDICANLSELKALHHRATTLLGEQSAAVLLNLPTGKKCISQSVKANGRLKAMLNVLSTNCQEKKLDINATLHARVTSLL